MHSNPDEKELNDLVVIETLQNSLRPEYRGYKVQRVKTLKSGRVLVSMKDRNGQSKTYSLDKQHFDTECGLFPIRTFPNLTGMQNGAPIRAYVPWSAADLFNFKKSFPDPRTDIDGFLRSFRELCNLWDPLPADMEKLLKMVLDPVDFTRVLERARDHLIHPWP